MMKPETTMLILIGFQNDYYAPDGILRGVIDQSLSHLDVVANTVALLHRLLPAAVVVVDTPIVFTPDYRELSSEPTGILKAIKEVGAFCAGTAGVETIAELRAFGSRIVTVPGKHGINAFSNTALDQLIHEHGIRDVVLAGAVTSVCIDSTGRSAYERGLKVHVLRDCTSARTLIEQEFYCDHIFPIYAQVLTSTKLVEQLGLVAGAAQSQAE
jgi:nicotinamidase-related amidase